MGELTFLKKIPTLRQYSRRATRIAQSNALPTAADEPASLLRDDSQGEAFPTVSGLKAGQDRENILKTSALPHDLTPRVTFLNADEGSMQQQQLQESTDPCTRLQRQQNKMASKINAQDLEISNLKARIKLLEDKDKGSAEPSGDDAPIKGKILTFMDAANILTSRVADFSVLPAVKVSTVGVPIGSGLVPTVSAIFTTSSVVTPYLRRKEMEEQMAREDQRMDEPIARDAEIARIHVEEELQMLIDGLDGNNEVIAKHLQKYEQSEAELTIREKIDLINELKQIEDSVPMASKEEGERVKRKGLKLEQGSAKKMKTSEDVSEEDLKEMMQLVPVEEVYMEALQVKHLIIDWEIHTEGKKDYWKIIRLGGHTAIARDAKIARIHTEEELKMMIDGLDISNEIIAKHLQEYEQSEAELTIGEKIELINELVKYQDHHAKILKYLSQQSKPLSKKEQKEFYMSILKSHAGWKTKYFREEGKRKKRNGLKLDEGSAKRMKTSEDVSEDVSKDVSEEDLKGMMQLVPAEETGRAHNSLPILYGYAKTAGQRRPKLAVGFGE
nr:hypothetical protein [Tanacetum cinerariifolium]